MHTEGVIIDHPQSHQVAEVGNSQWPADSGDSEDPHPGLPTR